MNANANANTNTNTNTDTDTNTITNTNTNTNMNTHTNTNAPYSATSITSQNKENYQQNLSKNPQIIIGIYLNLSKHIPTMLPEYDQNTSQTDPQRDQKNTQKWPF